MLTHSFSLKKAFLLIATLLFLEMLSAQENTQPRHLVKLKNGETIKGEILDMNQEQLIILDENQVEHTFKAEEILKVSSFKPTRAPRLREEQAAEKFYLNHTEFGILPGGGLSSYTRFFSFSFRNFSGFRVNRFFSPGVSLGVDFYPVVSSYSYNYYPSLVVFPISGGFRGELLRTAVTPFYTFDIGYGFAVYDKRLADFQSKGGFMFNPSVGLKIRLRGQAALTMALGFKTQKSGYRLDFQDSQGNLVQSTYFEQHFKRSSFLIGFLF